MKWILLGILLLLGFLLLLLRLRLRIHLALRDEGITLSLRAGPIHRTWPLGKAETAPPPEASEEPAKPSAEKPTKGEQEAAEEANPKKRKSRKPRDWNMLAAMGKEAAGLILSRLRRGGKIEPLNVSLTLGGKEDPAAAAQHYGAVQAAIWTIMPQLEERLTIPDPHLRVDLEFQSQETTLRGEIGLSLRLGTLLRIGWGLLGIALRTRRQRKKQQSVLAEEAETMEKKG